MHEKLKYTIEESTIAELLGTQNFTNKESAILELVKNSFDAKTEILNIYFKKNELIIEDDGIGMNMEDIKRHWMHIGKSMKDYVILDKNNNERILAGSKGIGRFALSRLGENIEIYSKKENDTQILWTTDWNKSFIEEILEEKPEGTKIIIKNLRDIWNEINIIKLSEYLSRAYKNDFMKIFINFNGKKLEVKSYFSETLLGINYLSKINLFYNSKSKDLICNIKSDEFREEAQLYCKNTSITNFSKTINMIDQLKNDKDLNLAIEELGEKLEILGDFSAELYFVLKPTKVDKERFLYKNFDSSNFYNSGVILYRNSFSISSYDGVKDWIGFSKRARKSPATAIHPTGSWRVRDNNIAGKVEIDKKDNYKLQDLSNRQGLEENEYYDIFIKILDKGLAIFEKHRQTIIRAINKKNDIVENYEEDLIEKIIKKPDEMKNLTFSETIRLTQSIQNLKYNTKQLKIKMEDTEKRYIYDFRILNTLSTSGLKATSIAHDLENYNNFIATNSDNLIKALKRCGVWEIVNSFNYTQIENRSVPKLIEKNKEINNKLSKFMSSILEESKKSKFIKKDIKLSDFLERLKNSWQRDYSRLDIELKIEEETILYTGEDLLKVIFDNLILNSFQQNKDKNNIKIEVEIKKEDNKIKVKYKDFGKGLDKKYQDDPFKILEVHETNRMEGHGLGMWIVNNTIKMYSGEIQVIKNNEEGGFQIEFTFGE